MSTLKENKAKSIRKKWLYCYEIVYKEFCRIADTKGNKPSVRGFCAFLNISMGKRNKWALGQWPSAEDMETLHDKLGFSYRWLITGEGDPFEDGGTLPDTSSELAHLKERYEAQTYRLDACEDEVDQLKEKLLQAHDRNVALQEKLNAAQEKNIRLLEERMNERVDEGVDEGVGGRRDTNVGKMSDVAML